MRRFWLGSLSLLVLAPVGAQTTPPFFGGGVVAYDPEVGIVQSGALMDAQAVVSADRKYVTINMRGDNSRLRSLERFPVVTEPQGFVGGTVFPGETPAAAPGARTPSAAPATPASASPDKIARAAKSWIFTRQGMYLVRPMK